MVEKNSVPWSHNPTASASGFTSTSRLAPNPVKLKTKTEEEADLEAMLGELGKIEPTGSSPREKVELKSTFEENVSDRMRCS